MCENAKELCSRLHFIIFLYRLYLQMQQYLPQKITMLKVLKQYIFIRYISTLAYKEQK